MKPVDNKIKITGNIDTLNKILNYWRIQNRIPAVSPMEYNACKWANSMFAVNYHLNNAANITGDGTSLPYFDKMGCSDSIFSHAYYNKVHDIVTQVNAQFYTQVDAGYNDQLTEVVLSIIAGSITVYAMMCALYRTQTGYLIKDEDKVMLSPVLLNHEEKGISVNDWTVGGGQTFAETVSASDLNTQAKIQNSKQVWGTYSVANEPWGNMVTNVIASTYLTDKVRAVIEHLYTNVFVDPEDSNNIRSVTLFPASVFRRLSTPNSNGDINVDFVRLYNGNDYYDTFDSNWGSSSCDNATTWNDFLNYTEAWHEMVNNLFSYYSQLDTIMEKLNLTNKSNFNFTRAISHDTMTFVVKENISDFIATVCAAQDSEAHTYGQEYALHGIDNPFVVRDQLDFRYGTALNYQDEVNIDLKYSFEMMHKLKVYPKRFAIYGKDSGGAAFYRFMTSVMHTLILTGGTAQDAYQMMSVQYINTDISDFGCVQSLYNYHCNQVRQSGLEGEELSIVPSIRTYYTPLENLGLYVARSWDTVLADE